MDNKLVDKLRLYVSYIWLGIPLIFAFAVIKMMCPDSDVYFLAATGRYIVENQVVPTINPFVIHGDIGIIVQQWLFDVLVYGIYGNFGTIGLYIYSCIVLIVTLALLYKYLRFFSNNIRSTIAVVGICAVVLSFVATSRPTSISIIVLITQLIVLETYKKTGKKRTLLALLLLSLVEINVHAAMWPMMFILVLPYLLPRSLPQKEYVKTHIKQYIKEVWGGAKILILVMFGMFVVGFVNPNGLRGMMYLILSYGSASQGNIAEMQSPQVWSLWGVILLIWLACIVIYLLRFKNKADLTRTCLALGTFVLACMHIRSIWMPVVGVAPLLVTLLAVRQNKRTTNNREHCQAQKNSLALLGVSVIGICAMVMIYTTASFSVEDSQTRPEVAESYLSQFNKDELVIYTEFNSGAYLEWTGYKVYIDARPEIYEEKINGAKNIYSEWLAVTYGIIDYDEFLESYGFTHLLVECNSPFDVYLECSDNYVVVVEGNGYCLYEAV